MRSARRERGRLRVDRLRARACSRGEIDSEDYPLMTVGELAPVLNVPREFVYAHAGELGAICLRLRLPDNNGKYSSKFERGGGLFDLLAAAEVYAHSPRRRLQQETFVLPSRGTRYRLCVRPEAGWGPARRSGYSDTIYTSRFDD